MVSTKTLKSGAILEPHAEGKKFSVIVALYNVEKYLDTFLNSIIRQTYPLKNLEIVIVDDGSTDSSYERVRVWAQRYPSLIRHTTKANGGPASARNRGLDLAVHEWVAFCDPDDALEERYFERVAAFIQRDEQNLATMLSTQVMIWQEELGRIKNTHPLGRKFSFGERLIDLNEDPNFAQLGGASIFLRRDIIEENGLRLSELIRPTFEDAEFIGRYLSVAPRQIVGIIPSAQYLYRKRGDGSSLVQSSWLKKERYHDVLEHGYLALLEGLKNKLGFVPIWAQNMVLYDMGWYLAEETRMRSATAWVEGELLETFHHLMKRIFYFIDRERIENYNMNGMSWITRQAMLTYYKGANVFPQKVVNWGRSGDHSILIGYAYYGKEPAERFLVDGVEVQPKEAKSVRHDYFKETFFFERKIWLPQGARIEVWLDGRFVAFGPVGVGGWSKPRSSLKLAGSVASDKYSKRFLSRGVLRMAPTSLNSVMMKAHSRIGVERLVSESTVVAASAAIARRMVSRKIDAKVNELSRRRDAKTRQWGLSEVNRKRFQEAWIVMDRPDHAGDNAEHLYRYLMKEQPETNARFLLNRDSPDWSRLEAEGFRLLEYGSRESVAAVLNSVVQISSDATAEVQYPIGRKRFGSYMERFVFLQHGITMNDLSRWLNQKTIALVCSATVNEYEAFVSDEGPYKFARSQVALTGFPRFDELARKDAELGGNSKSTLVIMPTWRQALKDGLDNLDSAEERAMFLRESEYGRAWIGLMSSEEFLQQVDDAGLNIVFVPHPAIAEYVSLFNLPPSVQVVNHAEVSLQDLFVSSRLLITDYSSVAFDVAFLNTPVIYYQFDAGEIFSGKHNYRRGYYDYTLHGFGPVVYAHRDVISEFIESRRNNFQPTGIYQGRIESTFEYVDTKSAYRVYASIVDLIG